MLEAPDGVTPAGVRYCQQGYPLCVLRNGAGLPAMPFVANLTSRAGFRPEPAISSASGPRAGFFESLARRHVAYLQGAERGGWNDTDSAALLKLAAAGLNTLIVSATQLADLLQSATPAQRATLLRFDFVLACQWPAHGLDIGDDTQSDFLPPIVRDSLSAALALSTSSAAGHPHIVGYYVADEPAWNKQSLFVAASASKRNMPLLNGWSYTCGWSPSTVPRPAGANGNWNTGFNVPCQLCLSSTTGAGSDIQLRPGGCGTAGQRSSSHWDWTLLQSPSPSTRIVSIQNNATAHYLCSTDGLSLSLEAEDGDHCRWAVTTTAPGSNTAPSRLQHQSSGAFVCGGGNGTALHLNHTGADRSCSWESFMWSAGLLQRMAKFLRAADSSKDTSGRPMRAIVIGGNPGPSDLHLVREWNSTNNYTAGDIECTLGSSCEVSCAGPHASDELIGAALAMSPVGTASHDAYDAFFIDAYHGNVAAYHRILLLMLRQGTLSPGKPWLPVLMSYSAQSTGTAGSAAACAQWASESASATGGTLREKLGWWQEAAARLNGGTEAAAACVTAPMGVALFAFENLHTTGTQSFSSLANCAAMQDQAVALFGDKSLLKSDDDVQ